MDDGFFSSSLVRAVRPPRSTVARCGECKLMNSCSSPKMKVTGQGEKQILIVGEAPGKDEDMQGVQFVGKTGKRLQAVLALHDISLRRDCWSTNAVICRPPKNELKNHPKAVDHCRPNLTRTVEELKPRVVVLLGSVAVKSLLAPLWKDDVGGVSRWAGFRIPCQKPNAWVCPTWHPSFVERESDPVVDAMFSAHLRAAVRVQGRPWAEDPPDYKTAVQVVVNPEEAAARIRKYKRGLVAFDFESDCLKPDSPTATLVSCAVCWEGQETIAFPWHGAARTAVCELLRDGNVGKIASNIKHEDRWAAARLGVRVRGWTWDTMLAAHLLDPRGSVSGLKFQAFVRLGCPDYDAHIHPFLVAKGGNAKNRIRDCDLRQLLVYNGLDALLEYQVAEVQSKDLGVTL